MLLSAGPSSYFCIHQLLFTCVEVFYCYHYYNHYDEQAESPSQHSPVMVTWRRGTCVNEPAACSSPHELTDTPRREISVGAGDPCRSSSLGAGDARGCWEGEGEFWWPGVGKEGGWVELGLGQGGTITGRTWVEETATDMVGKSESFMMGLHSPSHGVIYCYSCYFTVNTVGLKLPQTWWERVKAS